VLTRLEHMATQHSSTCASMKVRNCLLRNPYISIYSNLHFWNWKHSVLAKRHCFRICLRRCVLVFGTWRVVVVARQYYSQLFSSSNIVGSEYVVLSIAHCRLSPGTLSFNCLAPPIAFLCDTKACRASKNPYLLHQLEHISWSVLNIDRRSCVKSLMYTEIAMEYSKLMHERLPPLMAFKSSIIHFSWANVTKKRGYTGSSVYIMSGN
jgi:hypothetical protein